MTTTDSKIDLQVSLDSFMAVALKVKEERDRLVTEVRQLLANASYADGQAIVLTQDCEALESLLESMGKR